MWLILTTQLHLLTLLVPMTCSPATDLYPFVIIGATVVSSVWHFTQERVLWITTVDMTFALSWFVLDIQYALMYHTWTTFIQVLYLNIVVAVIHMIYESTKNTDRNAYIVHHSLWHVLSAAKCLAVASLIQCS